MITKKRLIKHLENDIYCRLAVSKVAGIGVIAIRDIPAGIDPFRNLFPHDEPIITLNKNDIKGLTPGTKKILKDFFGTEKGDSYDILSYGPNYLNISFYLNHSAKPNVDIQDSDDGYMGFKTNRKISKGEELFINYAKYDE